MTPWRNDATRPLPFVSRPKSFRGVPRLSFVALPLLCLLGASSCAVGPNFSPPKPPEVSRYTRGKEPVKTVQAAGGVQVFRRGFELAADWWRLFRSPDLDMIVREAIAQNYDLKAAQARLRQSQDNLRAAIGGFFPQFDGSFDATREKFTSARFGGQFGASNIFTLYNASASVNFNLDVFGRTRRTVEARRAEVHYQSYEEEATYLTLVGNVVNAVFAQASFRAQIEATQEIIQFEKEQLRIVKEQERAGMVPKTDVYSVQTELAATEASLPPLERNLSQSLNLLATLVGRAPAAWPAPAVFLEELSLPLSIPVTLPSELVRRRPDILASEALLHVASANIGVATASLFPSFDITGTYGQESLSFNNLFDPISNFWTLTGGVTAPLFHGGTLWAQRKAAINAYDEALANHAQTVLAALAQVADALLALEYDARTLRAQTLALVSSKKALDLVETSYKTGITSYIDLLIADRQYQQARIGYIQALTQRYQDTAALFVALGGGWWNQRGQDKNISEIRASYAVE